MCIARRLNIENNDMDWNSEIEVCAGTQSPGIDHSTTSYAQQIKSNNEHSNYDEDEKYSL